MYYVYYLLTQLDIFVAINETNAIVYDPPPLIYLCFVYKSKKKRCEVGGW